MFEKVMQRVFDTVPLVHCITNYVTVNDCANAILAVKGSPIMADDMQEVEDITAICQALVINIGTLHARTIESMIKAGKKANALGHPVILDPVGAGASKLRNETVFRLLKEVKFSVIRGNISEIKTLYLGSGKTKGVDADASDAVTNQIDESIALIKALSKQQDAIIAVSGAIDFIVYHDKAFTIYNGCKEMTGITGTGCMLTAIIGAYAGANPDHIFEATACASAMMGYAGELAKARMEKEGLGTGSLRTYIIDYLSRMDATLLNGGIQIEEK